MFRTLFFFALGGAITLGILQSTESDVFSIWTAGFITAAALFLGLWIVSAISRSSAIKRKIVDEALVKGNMRAALIVSRRQTGMYINENPQVEFNLLVDGLDGQPFLTTVRETVQLIDAHKFDRGELIAVVQPDHQFGDVYLVDAKPPKPWRSLRLEDAERARELPRAGKAANPVGGLGKVFVSLVVLVAGAVAGPFMATPDALAYAEMLFDGRGDEVYRIENEMLVDEGHLDVEKVRAALNLVAQAYESGGARGFEVYRLDVHERFLVADVPSRTSSDMVDMVNVRNRELDVITSRQVNPTDDDTDLFNPADINWQAVAEAIPAARDLAEERGHSDAILMGLTASRNNAYARDIQLLLRFEGGGRRSDIMIDAQGKYTPEELLEALPDTKRAVYLLEPSAFEQALEEITDFAETWTVSELSHYGDRLVVHVHSGGGAASRTANKITYRNGRIDSVKNIPEVDDSALFDVYHFEWAKVLEGVAAAQDAFAAAGSPGATFSHITAANFRVIGTADTSLVARVYLRAGDSGEGSGSGFVELSPAGEVVRVQN